MSLPDYQSFMTPLLQCLASGKTVKLKDIEANVYQSLSLSAEQLKLRIPSGKQTESPRVHRRPVCLSQATLPDSFKLS